MYKVIKNNTQIGYTWIDVVDPTERELEELATKFNLHQTSLQDILQPEHLPKYEQFEDLDFIICRYYDTESAKEADSILQMTRKLAIFFRKNLLLTIHRKASPSLDTVIEKYLNNDKVNTFELTCKIIKAVLNSYEEPTKKLEEYIDFYESRIFLKKRIPDLLKNLYQLKRKIYIFRKVSNLTEDIFEHLRYLSSTYNAKPQFQDLKDYYIKLDTTIESNYDDINNLLKIYISLSSQRTNEVMRTLTVFTAFFLPTTFIVGLYGMNFAYMPELAKPWGYPAVLIFMATITAIIYIWFKRKGWM